MYSILILGFLASADPSAEHPLAKSKVGDSVTLKTPGLLDGAGFTIKRTVVARTNNSVTIEIDSFVWKMHFSSEETFNLKQQYDPTQMSTTPSNGKLIGEGREKILVAGKQYDCKWVAKEIKDGTRSHRVKVWMSKDVPLEGIVRVEGDTDGSISTLELTSSDRGK